MPTKQDIAPSPAYLRPLLVVVLLGLAVFTAYRFFPVRQSYRVDPFQTPSGWGYDIRQDERVLIHQPGIPGVAGNVGFSSEAQARQVGERVIQKLNDNDGLPTLTHDELRQLGVSVP